MVKKIIYGVCAVLFALSFTTCKEPDDKTLTGITWQITWVLNSGTAGTGAYPAQIVKGAVLARPSPNPTRAGFTFDGWYSDSALTQEYNFANTVTANLTLYAKWNAAGGEWVTVWEMATDESIQALEDGAVVPFSDDVSIAPLMRVGGDSDVTITALKVDGKTSLEVETGANWGAGLDLRYEAFGFQAGDKITVTGELLSDGYTQLNFTIGSEDAKGFKKDSQGAFNWNVELTARWVAVFKNTSPAGIRFEGRPRGVIFRVDSIKIEGNRRPTDIKKAAPVIALADNGVSWTAVEGANGYKIFANGEQIGTAGADATGFNVNSVSSLATGEYTITVVAAGVAGVSADSDPSNAVVFTKTGVSTIYQVPAAGDGFFFVNLNDFETQTPSSANINSTVPAGVLAADKLTLTFTENNQRANFKLKSFQTGILTTAESVKVTIVGTATPDTSFRYHIGNALTGADWNATNGSGDGAFSTKLVSEQTFTANRDDADSVGYFIFQQSAAATTTVAITSIKIEYFGAAEADVFELGDFNWENADNANLKGWDIAGDALGFLPSANYLVVETKGSSNRDGFGGFFVILQPGHAGWNQINLWGDWISLSTTAKDTVYIVVKLDALTDYDAFAAAGGNLIIAAYPLTGLGYQNAFLVADIDKPAGAADIPGDKGFIYKE